MLRPVPQRQIAVSLVVLASYLCAAFLDCDPEASFRAVGRVGIAASHAHGLAADRAGQAIPAPGAKHAGHAEPAPGAKHAGHAGPAPGAKHAGHAGPAPGAKHAGHATQAERRDARAVRAASKQAVLKASCTCGCSDTRARVGGGTGRLGAVVPGVFLARLPEAARVDGAAPAPGLLPAPFSELDPIPI